MREKKDVAKLLGTHTNRVPDLELVHAPHRPIPKLHLRAPRKARVPANLHRPRRRRCHRRPRRLARGQRRRGGRGRRRHDRLLGAVDDRDAHGGQRGPGVGEADVGVDPRIWRVGGRDAELDAGRGEDVGADDGGGGAVEGDAVVGELDGDAGLQGFARGARAPRKLEGDVEIDVGSDGRAEGEVELRGISEVEGQGLAHGGGVEIGGLHEIVVDPCDEG
mmetsp:Transcript_10086/g.25288  ORF Transcript_10086/g.25288 Transcript_10086/m.25288 type:complete len:220 (+) Transcript_10086:591-1250(+)